MTTRQQILDEIRRTAKDGKPLGYNRFAKETGIKPHEWGKYWARFGDAQKEAGLSANQLQGAYSDEFLIAKVIALARRLGTFPTGREIVVEGSNNAELPSATPFKRLGNKEQLAKKVLEYCKNKDGYSDIVELCKPILARNAATESPEEVRGDEVTGEVYLFKSGRYYKIGKTIDTVRRGTEIRIQLPEKVDLIHSIKTDDPSGIESYWHKRFDSKRMNGEWFDLSSADVRAFKRWRRIY